MKKTYQQKGTVLLITFLILGVLLLLGLYFLDFTLTESRISRSQELGSRAYYLAEAGINEAVWKLKNDNTTTDGDPAWADEFAASPTWNASFSHSFGGGSYDVSIQNYAEGAGNLISTARIPIGDKYAQRIVKVSVFRALASPVADSALFSGGPSGNMNVSSSNITVNDGNLFCGNVFNISSSNLSVNNNPDTSGLEGKVLVNNNLLSSSTTITAEAECAKNTCTLKCDGYEPGEDSCPPDSLDLPLVDFNSPQSNSFKSRAQAAENAGQCQILCNGSPCSTKCVLTKNQFAGVLSSGQNITVNSEITYITGDINISSKNLTVNGILVGENDINVSSSVVTVNRPDSQSPSGLISGRRINISSTTMNITGTIYSYDQMNMSSSSGDITGAILGRKFNFSSLPSLTINLDNDIMLYGLGYIIDGQPVNPTFSPVITIDHWEEAY